MSAISSAGPVVNSYGEDFFQVGDSAMHFSSIGAVDAKVSQVPARIFYVPIENGSMDFSKMVDSEDELDAKTVYALFEEKDIQIIHKDSPTVIKVPNIEVPQISDSASTVSDLSDSSVEVIY